MKKRCEWVPVNDQLYLDYHDLEWGVPLFDDRRLFEMLILEGAQAGLSWSTILKKRDNFRVAFDGFTATKIAGYDQQKISELLKNPGIIRNRLKITSAIENAKAFLVVQKEYNSFAEYIWQFVGGTPKTKAWKKLADIPAQTKESMTMSKDLTKRGFSFVGPTICYAFMQAVGMVNDHTTDCYRYHQINIYHLSKLPEPFFCEP